MSVLKSNLEFRPLDELEDSGLLDDAIANATERRHNAKQDDFLPDLLSEEANSVVGGLARPITTCGIIACEPVFYS